MSGLTWRGDVIVRQIESAAERQTARVVDRALETAKADTPVLTGDARESLRRESAGLAITWGYHVGYGVFIEVGSEGRAGHHALRRAADIHYPELAPGIRDTWS